MRSFSGIWRKVEFRQFVRFCIVGIIAAGIHYLVYYLLQLLLAGSVGLSVAYTIGYIVSLVCNFVMTTYFTFRSRASIKKAAGFGGSHAVNYTLHIVLFNLFLSIGINRLIAPILVLMIAVPTNFTLLHFVYHNKKETK